MEKWKIETLIDIAKRGTLTVEGQQNCAKLIEAQRREIWQAKQERDSQQRCAIKAMTEAERLQAQIAAMREVILELKPSCGNCNPENCTENCENIRRFELIDAVLSSYAGKDYHNPDDESKLIKLFKLLEISHLALKRSNRDDIPVVRDTLELLDKALGGSEDGI